jgi:hypothetical protein
MLCTHACHQVTFEGITDVKQADSRDENSFHQLFIHFFTEKYVSPNQELILASHNRHKFPLKFQKIFNFFRQNFKISIFHFFTFDYDQHQQILISQRSLYLDLVSML